MENLVPSMTTATAVHPAPIQVNMAITVMLSDMASLYLSTKGILAFEFQNDLMYQDT